MLKVLCPELKHLEVLMKLYKFYPHKVTIYFVALIQSNPSYIELN